MHARMVVQADKSEFDLLAVYPPAPSFAEGRQREIRAFWEALHDQVIRLGDLVLIAGDFNAESWRRVPGDSHP